MDQIKKAYKHPSSFRDPSGFLFQKDGMLYRQINNSYKEHYDYFINSKLYEKLTNEHLLILHKEVSISPYNKDYAYKTIQPEKITFISYPYEWCFSQIKDAALLTLDILKIALEHKMILKDASAFNIQFYKNKPILIDTLSFQKWKEGDPWIGYRQFCQHFLAPLLLMSYKDIRLNKLLINFIDGIPLDLTSKLLPKITYLNIHILSHIHMHSRSQNYFSDKKIDTKKKLGSFGLKGIIESLYSLVKSTQLKTNKTEWNNYYQATNYSDKAFIQKKEIVSKFIDEIKPKTVWDIGANTGEFSRIASKKNIFVISFDLDPLCVEKNYLDSKNNNEKNILPLLSDLTNPTPSIGWNNNERDSLKNRGRVDTILALALIHHLVISNNIPLEYLAEYFAELCDNLIIEFVPKEDSQVQKLLQSREDIFSNYNVDHFEKCFLKFFIISKNVQIINSKRNIFLMKKS